MNAERIISIYLEQYQQDELNPALWVGSELKIGLRDKFIKIAKDFYSDLGYSSEAPIVDIQLTGSNANYNWTQYSDVDVHILIDFNDINPDYELVKSFVDFARWKWNVQHSPKINGYEIELYIQDKNEPHVASGLYSLLHDEWVTIPEKGITQDVDPRDVVVKVDTIKTLIDKFVTSEEGKGILNKIKKMRSSGLALGGEYSIENLAFKELRNSGYIELLINKINKAYDREAMSDV